MPKCTPCMLAAALVAGSMVPTSLAAQTPVASPERFFGHQIGANYVLPNYTAFTAYWKLLDAQSDRMKVVEIGTTAEGRPQFMAIISAPENLARLDRYREISRRLALAEGLADAAATELAREGKAVVWIDGGLHANEVLGAQQLIETSHQLVTRADEETMRILRDVVVLLVHANPDGMELVSDWYMQEKEPTRRTFMTLPRLYQKYAGHDNNRDFYASTQPETENMNRVMYREWYPQIMYNHHQAGPMGMVMFAPPFRDPYNQVVHPAIRTGLELLGAAMHGRFIAEKKPGVGTREGAGYSTWFNGGLRTTAYFHNILGLLTETKGSPTPDLDEGRSDIPLIPRLQMPAANMPYPIEPQRWSFRSSVEYSVTANYAVLDAAQRYKDAFLLNIYRMGRDAIEAGRRDSWTPYPRRLDRLQATLDSIQKAPGYRFPAACAGVRGGMPLDFQRPCMGSDAGRPYYHQLVRAPELRDARGYILPSDQPDFPTAVKFVNALLETGVRVERATAAFTVGTRAYPAGSFVVRTDQAFRPHVLDMFEPQDHPNDFEYPGGPPIHPYDNAGYTLALQMGVKFDRILDGFDGPFERLTEWNVAPPAGRVEGAPRSTGYLLSPSYNDAFRAASVLLSAGDEVYRLSAPLDSDGRSYPPGSFYLPQRSGTRARLEKLAAELGLTFTGVGGRPTAPLVRLRQPRIALWDEYGGSIPSGWQRWVLDQLRIPYTVVFPQELDGGKLRAKYDVIVFPDGAIGPDASSRPGPNPARVPPAYRPMLGRVTAERTVPRLREFLEAGGSVVAIGHSTSLASMLGLPIGDKLVDEQGRALTGDRYFIPASLLRVRVDNSRPLTYGMDEYLDVMFDESPVFALGADAEAHGVRRIAWFDRPDPLRSGWAWGQHFLEGGVAVAQAHVGAGNLFLFGPEILFRSQPHGSYKLFLNALYHPVAGR